jgi:hypothetical protein
MTVERGFLNYGCAAKKAECAPLLREGIKRVVLGLEEVPKSTTSKT